MRQGTRRRMPSAFIAPKIIGCNPREINNLKFPQPMKQRTIWMAPLVCLAQVTTIASACEVIVLTSPVLGSQITDDQPELTWDRKAPGNFRVQIAVSLPEARVISSTDVITADNRFKLPVPISSSLASVKELVSQGCPDLDAQDLNALGPAFFINTGMSCSLPDKGLQQTGNQLLWDPVGRAERYRVRLFELKPDQHGVSQATLISTTETRLPSWPIPTSTETSTPQSKSRTRTRVATVHPICNGLTGAVQASRLPDAP